MLKRLRNTRGQSVVEYLLIAGVIIAAIVGIRTQFQARVNNVLTESQNKVDASVTLMQNNELTGANKR